MATKSALVTGASSGIGYALAIELAERGYRVFAGARRLSRMKPLEDLGITTFELDVGSLESIERAVEFISENTGGKLDLLFNNAGIQCFSPAVEVDDEKFQKCFQINVYGPIRLIRELAPLVIKSRGVIAFTGSTAGLNPFPFLSIYAATKGAIHSYASTLAMEMIPFGVRVLNVITGGVATEIGDDKTLASNSWYRIEDEDILATRPTGQGVRLSAPKYASRTCDDIEKAFKQTSPNYIVSYRGSESSWHLFLASYTPRWIIERKILKDFFLKSPYKRLQKYYQEDVTS